MPGRQSGPIARACQESAAHEMKYSSLAPLFKLLALLRCQIGDTRSLAQLQGPNVSDHLVAILRSQLICVARHSTDSVGDHIIKVGNRLFEDPLVSEGWWPAKSAFDDQTLAISKTSMTWRTGDVESFLTSLQDLLSNCKWEGVISLLWHPSGHRRLLLLARECALGWKALCLRHVRLESRLILHIAT